MKKGNRFVFHTVAFFLLVTLFIPSGYAKLISAPGLYEGYSDKVYDGRERSSEYVTVQAGTPLETRLAVDINRPTLGGQLVETPLPVLFYFTPYSRVQNLYDKAGKKTGVRYRGPIDLTAYGYVVVVADTRGMGASYGFRKSANDRIEARDARELIDWIAHQKAWCDGNVGMYGVSYNGQTVLEAVSMEPTSLKAVWIGQTDFDKYDGWSRGGIPRGSAAEVFTKPEAEYKRNVPVDGDKDSDGDGHADQLWAAVQEHQDNNPFTGLILKVPYRDSYSEYSENNYWEAVGASTYLGNKVSPIPAYIEGGWYDFLRRDSIMNFANWQDETRKMIMGPWRHGGSTQDKDFDIMSEIRRFFDYWLKGIDNGIMDEPPIYFSTLVIPKEGKPQVKKWRYANQWPPQPTKGIKYYLQKGRSGTAPSQNDGILNTTAPVEEAGANDKYKVVYGIETNVEPLYFMAVASGAEVDKKGLTYTTAPLSEDVEVTGHPVVNFWISSDSPNGDFIVFLEDVDPETGASTYISDGRLRASLRSIDPPPYNFLGLPWHRSYREDEQKLIPGKPVNLKISMMPTSYIFEKGHRIRLAVVGSQGRLFNLDPANVDPNDPNDPDRDAPEFVSIYRNKVHLSYISLPVRD